MMDGPRSGRSSLVAEKLDRIISIAPPAEFS
jgi:hypothetical protein